MIEPLPDFTGKLVTCIVSSMTSTQNCFLLEYSEFQLQGGRLFLVGRGPELKELEWCSRMRMAVAWDSVSAYYVYDSREDFIERNKTAQPGLFKRLFRVSGS